MSEERTVRIINSTGALKSLRKLGVNFDQGLGELMDNSIDAGARTIYISVKYEGESLSMVIIDDGIGIPEQVPGKNINDTIQHVLRFGGKIAHGGHPFPIGRFGFGLSQTANCLSSRTTVYSKTKLGTWRSCYIDEEDLIAHNAFLPPEQKDVKVPDFLLSGISETLDHGTIIHLEGILSSGYSTEGHLLNHISRELGRIYRHSLSSGVRISLGVLEQDHREEVIIRDPLGLMPESYEAAKFNQQQVNANIRLIFDGQDVQSFGRIIDQDTGEPAVIEIKMVNFDIASVYTALGVQPNVVVAGKVIQSKKQRLALGKEGFNLSQQGFSIVRNGREIQHGFSQGIYGKTDTSNYFRAQLMFPKCLDSLFRIQVNKSRFTLDDRLRDVIRDRCRAKITEIQTNTRTTRSHLRAKGHDSVTPTAEERSTSLRNLFPRTPPEQSKHAELKKKLEQAKQERIDKVTNEEEKKVSEAERALEAAELMQKASAIKAAKEVLENAQQNKQERIKNVRNRFKNDAFMRKFVESIPGGDLYEIRDYHDEIWVIVNQNSEFFKSLYERASQHAERQALLDLMIFAIAHAEATKSNSNEMRAFWLETRKKITRFSQLFVSVFDVEEDEPIDLDEEVEKDREYELQPQASLMDWGEDA